MIFCILYPAILTPPYSLDCLQLLLFLRTDSGRDETNRNHAESCK